MIDGYNDFDHLYTTYRRWLMVIAVGILQNEQEAEELVQEFFIDLWQHQTYKNIPVGSKEATQNYLFVSIKNRCLNRIAREDTRLKRLNRFLIMPGPVTLPDNKLENTELKNQLDDAIGQLPPRQNQVFQSAYLMDKSRKEIADEMKISEKTVKKQMQLALKALRNYLKNIH
ncbi:RNA polymerase sigma-70 factor [Chitinophaga sp. SYP-B3965]|uniref:RNA polymerase sigma-70 factor n=1 Tax=Chitinophaga sp. SYP-B3965 TaxID=2663120 RepID=UPI001299C050|nr:RNA polymerase sigma-70 factor [Chitinophaga sp. SYP-B3965]MRG45848.1 RNA polymerase sigma-70 factor [Chitinophaga sp. SYP-B3965]